MDTCAREQQIGFCARAVCVPFASDLLRRASRAQKGRSRGASLCESELEFEFEFEFGSTAAAATAAAAAAAAGAHNPAPGARVAQARAKQRRPRDEPNERWRPLCARLAAPSGARPATVGRRQSAVGSRPLGRAAAAAAAESVVVTGGGGGGSYGALTLARALRPAQCGPERNGTERTISRRLYAPAAGARVRMRSGGRRNWAPVARYAPPKRWRSIARARSERLRSQKLRSVCVCVARVLCFAVSSVRASERPIERVSECAASNAEPKAPKAHT